MRCILHLITALIIVFNLVQAQHRKDTLNEENENANFSATQNKRQNEGH